MVDYDIVLPDYVAKEDGSVHKYLASLHPGERYLFKRDGATALVRASSVPAGVQLLNSRPLLVPENGCSVSFSVATSPMVSVKDAEGKYVGKKFLNDPEMVQEWFYRRLAKAGARLLSLKYQGKMKVWIKGRPVGQSQFTGTLFIEDSEKFRELLCGGLGRHKAYGFGLVQICL